MQLQSKNREGMGENSGGVWETKKRKKRQLLSPGPSLERETKDGFCTNRNRLSRTVDRERNMTLPTYIPTGPFLWRLCTSSNREKSLCLLTNTYWEPKRSNVIWVTNWTRMKQDFSHRLEKRLQLHTIRNYLQFTSEKKCNFLWHLFILISKQ